MSRNDKAYESFNLSGFLEYVKENSDELKKKKSKKLKEDANYGSNDSKGSIRKNKRRKI